MTIILIILIQKLYIMYDLWVGYNQFKQSKASKKIDEELLPVA